MSIIGRDNTILGRGLAANHMTLNDLAHFMNMYDSAGRTVRASIDSNEKATAAILFVLGIKSESPHAYDKYEEIFDFAGAAGA